ncbi:MAG TPA: DUF6249 domain-containing protein [Steroidobacteraceae bacterium]|nr:DUF6249 domain-containing protein [Steroidobacteraceae bacterium]
MSDSTDVIAVLIPVIAIITGVGIGMLSIYLDARRKREMFQLYHAERMAAIEKGIELPPLPEQFFLDSRKRESSPVRQRRMGLVLLFIGIAVTIALWQTVHQQFWWGLVPVAIGLAFLISSQLERREAAKAPGDKDSDLPAPR